LRDAVAAAPAHQRRERRPRAARHQVVRRHADRRLGGAVADQRDLDEIHDVGKVLRRAADQQGVRKRGAASAPFSCVVIAAMAWQQPGPATPFSSVTAITRPGRTGSVARADRHSGSPGAGCRGAARQ
jgi:hypothetical protein